MCYRTHSYDPRRPGGRYERAQSSTTARVECRSVLASSRVVLGDASKTLSMCVPATRLKCTGSLGYPMNWGWINGNGPNTHSSRDRLQYERAI